MWLPIHAWHDDAGYRGPLMDIDPAAARVDNIHAALLISSWQRRRMPTLEILLYVLPKLGATIGGAYRHPGQTFSGLAAPLAKRPASDHCTLLSLARRKAHFHP